MKKDLVQALLKKVKDEYEFLAEDFSNTRQRQWVETISLVEYIQAGDKVLDWGCGNGRLYQLLLNKQVSYLGIDNCKGLIAKAQAKYPDAEWLLGSDIPYQSFDKILAIASWHHLPGQRLRLEKMEEFHDRLKLNGYLLLTTWNLKQKRYFWLWLKNNLRNIFSDYDWNDILVPWHARNKTVYRYYHNFSKRALSKVAKQAGFEVEDCFYSHKGARSNWWSGYNLVLIAKKG